ncbi:MAG: hypothetical protein KatS3mg118_3715 [Paracoccaceae bacterium]|nr:MAG: hypothetical protein KatS3mg118_3715 [Paracoccaceae bacterium]
MGRLDRSSGRDVHYAIPERPDDVTGFSEGGPMERHRRARQVGDACWQRGSWTEALLHYMEAESHLMAAGVPAARRNRSQGG